MSKKVKPQYETSERSQQLDATNGADNPDNMMQVREILFGTQMREFDRKVGQLQEHIGSDVGKLKDEIKNRTDSLERYVKNELESLLERLGREQADREKSVKGLSAKITDLSDTLDQKFSQLEEKLNKTERSLREHLLEETKNLRSEVEERNNEQSMMLERQTKSLQEDKVDRMAMSDMFKELAVRLSGDFTVPMDGPKPK